MKHYIQILIVLLLTVLVSCSDSDNNQESDIKIVHDTLTIDVKGSLGQIIKHQDKYYCFFERSNPYSSKSFKDFYILSSEGKIIKKIDVPEKLNNFYYDLHVRYDSIITKEYWNHYTFYLDLEKSEWVEINEVDDLIFEDEQYYVTHLGFGEFGSTVWFKDKTTRKEYEFSSTTPSIFKINGNYFLSNSREVFKINPKKMMPCDSSNFYKVVEGTKNMRYGSQFINGGEYLFKDTVNPYESTFYIATSFIFKDSLFHLCVDSNKTFIAVIDSGKIEPYKTIVNDISVYKYHYAYRGNQFDRKNQLIKFNSQDRKREGVIEIENDIIRVTDIINTNSINILGAIKTEKNFRFLTSYHFTNFNKLSPPQLDSIIPEHGGYDVTPNHEMVFGGNPCLRSFKFVEDTTITLLVDYYFSKSKDSLKVIKYEWRETWENDYKIYAPKDEKLKIKRFQTRLDSIAEFLKSNFGEPIRNENGNNYTSMEWDIVKGLNIRLSWNHFDNHRRIRLTIKTD